MTRAVLAPGKAMLIGEYAVLEGEPAVVAAVSVYARAVLGSGVPSSGFIAAAIREARVELADLGRTLDGELVPQVDTTAFVHGGRKLGVGSSAAATVAAVGALFDAAGCDLGDEQVRARAFAAAKRAHDAAQGTAGSGADLWAAVHGKLRVLGPYDTSVESRALPVQLRFVATSTSVSTAMLVGRYRAQHDAAQPAIAELAIAARGFLMAWQRGDVAALLSAVERANSGYERLGEALGQRLLTDDHLRIAETARRAGGAAKPSGAGGGDLAVVFLPTRAAVERFCAEIEPLPITESAVGLHVAS
jgi:mevalonate kinase